MRTVFTITNRSYRSSSSWPLLWAVRLLNAFKKNAMHYWRHKIPQEFHMVAPLRTAWSPSFVPFPTRARNKAHQRLLYSLAQRMDLLIIGCELRVYTAPFSQISCLEHTKLFPHRGFYAAEVVPTRSTLLVRADHQNTSVKFEELTDVRLSGYGYFPDDSFLFSANFGKS